MTPDQIPGRARVALRWTREAVPAIDPGWIDYLVRVYDRTHSGELG
ncbi:MAG: hypothetical protein HY900_17585 [Deltaproteobacteria bacterium]|nr:hypothetical protein [Deltaproteobacteria bacterium]